MAEVDVVVWAHRKHPIQDACERSVMERTTGDFAFHRMIEPGSCHVNMNRAFRTGSARYVCLLDEDVEIITREWLWLLLAVLKADEGAGVVTCHEVKSPDEQSTWLSLTGDQPLTSHAVEIPWAPAYVTLYDRQRTPWLIFDEEIPGLKGMTDLDASLQLKAIGLRCMRHIGVCVYHPHKGDEDSRRALETSLKADEISWFPAQVRYMEEKWGNAYVQAVMHASAMFDKVSTEKPFHNPLWFEDNT